MPEDVYMLIQNKYRDLQKQAKEASDRKIAILYHDHPQLKSITDEISSLSGELIKLTLKRQPQSQIDELKTRIDELKALRQQYITDNNVDMSAFVPQYLCPECNDTGKLPNGTRCSCFSDHYAQIKFGTADMSILRRENFEIFDLNVFPEKAPNGTPQREQMAHLKSAMEDYCNTYPEVAKKNILISGKTGTGKSFLLNCIAKALSDRGIPVIRLSAYKMINELFSKYIDDSTDFDAELERICETEVLMIDDLGTELMKENFTHNTLYYILDRRAELAKATVISTNLNVKQLEDKYSDRIMSRLFNTRTTNAIQLSGADIRLRR